MIPLEILTMGGSAVVGMIMKLMDQKADRENRLLAQATMERQEIREDTNPHSMWTRRIIALTVVFAVMVLPKVAALLGLPVSYGQVESSSWFFGLFGNSSATTWYTVGGMPITPADTHALAAVIGLYFGARRT